MILGKAVNHGEHGVHSEKQEFVFACIFIRWVSFATGQKTRIFAVPAVFTVVESRFLG
jgi:hypothetical protein